MSNFLRLLALVLVVAGEMTMIYLFNKAAIERDNAIAVEKSQPRKRLKKSAMIGMGASMLYAYILNTTFYYDDHDYLRRSYYGSSKRQRR